MGRKKRSRKKQYEDPTTWPPDENMSGWRKARRKAAEQALLDARRALVRRDVRFYWACLQLERKRRSKGPPHSTLPLIQQLIFGFENRPRFSATTQTVRVGTTKVFFLRAAFFFGMSPYKDPTVHYSFRTASFSKGEFWILSSAQSNNRELTG